MDNESRGYLVLSHLRVQNVNAVSSPLTWGFPALTAISGFVHTVERKLNEAQEQVKFEGIGIVCHSFEPQIYRASPRSDATFCLTRNPLGSAGETQSINEEGRAHVTLSLIIELSSHSLWDEPAQLKEEKILNLVYQLRLAGGNILPQPHSVNSKKKAIELVPRLPTSEGREAEGRKMLRKMLPGFILTHQPDILNQHLKNLQKENSAANLLDALLDFSRIYTQPHYCEISTQKTIWTKPAKPVPGWFVPISIGYQALSEVYPPGRVLNARDKTTAFRFVENIYSLGQWISPHRFENISDIFWHPKVDEEAGLYYCACPSFKPNVLPTHFNQPGDKNHV